MDTWKRTHTESTTVITLLPTLVRSSSTWYVLHNILRCSLYHVLHLLYYYDVNCKYFKVLLQSTHLILTEDTVVSHNVSWPYFMCFIVFYLKFCLCSIIGFFTFWLKIMNLFSLQLQFLFLQAVHKPHISSISLVNAL